MNPQTLPQPEKPQGCYTAAQLAAGLQVSKLKVWKCLRGVPACGSQVVRGNEAEAWTIEALPSQMRERLARRAYGSGQGIADLIRDANKPWEPKIPLGEVVESYLQDARKLREALLPSLQILDAPAMTSADLWRRGLGDYRRVFGHPVSERHWRRLIDRTLRRDGGRAELQRLELYLHEHPARAVVAVAAQTAEPSEFREVANVIANANETAPSSSDKAMVWLSAFRCLERLSEGRDQKGTQIEMIHFLWHRAPWLARSENALRVSFGRKYDKWARKGRKAELLADGREKRRGIPTAIPYKKGDVELIKFRAVELNGRRAQAFRECNEEGLVTDPRLIASYNNSLDKSYVPAPLRAELRNVPALCDLHQGGRAAQKQRPSLQTEYSGIFSMDAISLDDFTFDVKFRIPADGGKWRLIKGQCLLAADLRSDKILSSVVLDDIQDQAEIVVSGINLTRAKCMQAQMDYPRGRDHPPWQADKQPELLQAQPPGKGGFL